MSEYLDDKVETRPRRRARASSRTHGMDDYETGRVRRHSREPELAGIPVSTIKYISLAILIVVAAICGYKFLEVSLPIVLVLIVIVVIMGVVLHSTPVFVSVLLAAAILIAGMLTGNTDIVICAISTYLGTILVLKEN